MSSQRTPKPVRSYHLIALVLASAFVGQCCWFVSSVPLTQLETVQVERGIALLERVPSTATPYASPLVPLLSVAGIAFRLPPDPLRLDPFWLDHHRWAIRLPFLFAGLALAFSLWYVARRLYGNAGGHVALALYAFSPGIVACSSMASPQIFAAWGAFGLIFTALATAHTLYAPREVLLWNWRRILLLGISIGFAAGAQWPLVWLLVPAAAFMVWVVPHRRPSALLILFAGTVVGLALLDVCYFGNLHALGAGLLKAGVARQSIGLASLARLLAGFYFDTAPAALAGSLVALAAWCASRRSRFFGNTAPLLVFFLLLIMSVLFALSGPSAILFASLPFLLLFTAGVFADLVDGQLQTPAIVFIFAIIFAQAAYSIIGLAHMYSRVS